MGLAPVGLESNSWLLNNIKPLCLKSIPPQYRHMGSIAILNKLISVIIPFMDVGTTESEHKYHFYSTSSSPDKHICGWVDPQRSWFVRNAFPQFRLKMTKIANFARAVARPTKVDSGILTDFWKAQTMLFLKC